VSLKENASYQAVGALLCYPDSALVSSLQKIEELLDTEERLSRERRNDIKQLIDRLRCDDLIDSQELYVSLFDRTRSLSLHLFEHVHGESRDRGQAMVDLMDLYKEHGLELSANELPDYLPLFLEFLSSLPPHEAHENLLQPIEVIRALRDRLIAKHSDYAIIFDSLLDLAGITLKPLKVQEEIIDIDKEWEEEQVTFLGAELEKKSGCSSGGCGGGCKSGLQISPKPGSGDKHGSSV
jgi:nitrate reductase delta subunit